MLTQLRDAGALTCGSPMPVAELLSICNCPIHEAEEALQDLQTLGLVARCGDRVHLTALSREVIASGGTDYKPRPDWQEAIFPIRRRRSPRPRSRGLHWITRRDTEVPQQPVD